MPVRRDAAAPAVLRSHAPRWCISRSTGQIPGESCLAGAHPATGPPARASSAKPPPTREALLLGTAFASGGGILRGTADCPGALLQAKRSSLTGLTHVGHAWMPWGCPRQTSSSRDRARGGLEMVPPCRKPTGAQTSGCRRAGGAGRGCSEGDFSLPAPFFSRRQHLGVLSPILTPDRNKHLRDKPNGFVVVCFVCSFLLSVPGLALPRYFTGEWGRWPASGVPC